MARWGVVVGVGFAVALANARAGAQEEAPRAWHLAAGVGTDFPLGIAARVQGEGPMRLRLSTSLGLLPSPYVSAINGILKGFSVYDQTTAELIAVALDESLVWRTHLGWRPFASNGFFIDAGYGLVTLGGGATASEIVEVVTGKTIPPQARRAGERVQLDVGSVLHMLDVELGYDFVFWEHLHLRAAVGGAFTVASSASVKPSVGTQTPQRLEPYAREAEDYLKTIYRQYVHTPTVSVGAGFRFF